MERPKSEYQTSSFCNYGDCVGVSSVYSDVETREERIDIVNTKRPDQGVATVPRDHFARLVAAVQEELLSTPELITYAREEEGGSFMSSFSDEEIRAFHKGIMAREFDEAADVDGYLDRMPEDMEFIEDYLGFPRMRVGRDPFVVRLPHEVGYLAVGVDPNTGGLVHA